MNQKKKLVLLVALFVLFVVMIVMPVERLDAHMILGGKSIIYPNGFTCACSGKTDDCCCIWIIEM